MKLAAILIALIASGSALTGAAAMQWDHFRRSTNIEDRTTRPALIQPLDLIWDAHSPKYVRFDIAIRQDEWPK